jgi:hypothetical protein
LYLTTIKPISSHAVVSIRKNTNADLPFGSSAIFGSFVAAVEGRGGGEDPWLCDPGFRRVGSCRGESMLGQRTRGVKQSLGVEQEVSRGRLEEA